MMGAITASDLRKRIGASTRGKWSDVSQRYLGVWDEELLVPTRQDVAEYITFARGFVDISGIRSGDLGEGFDCEDFAFAFMALARLRAAQRGGIHSVAIGLAFGVFAWRPLESHCCNWVLVDSGNDRRLAWIEPQDLIGSTGQIPLRPFDEGQFNSLKVMIA